MNEEVLLEVLLAIPVALFGAVIGSFLNVVAWRLPRRESIIRPGSHCPRCGTFLSWFENLPLISWLLLGGRCRHCREPIAWRYPLVELLTAVLWVAVLAARPGGPGAGPLGPGPLGPEPLGWLTLAAGWLLISWLLALSLIDIDSLWLPEPLCRWGVLLGLAITALAGFLQGADVGRSLLLWHLIAAGTGLLGFEAVSGLAERAFGRPALGLGDAKLAALIGAWLGLSGLGLTVMLAILSGGLLGAVGRLSGRLKRHQAIPFGPFLAGGATAVWLGGHAFWLERLGLGL